MKRTTIALLALGTASASAHAQSAPSGVTLYGVVDTAIEYASHVANSAPTINPATGAVTQAPGGSRVQMVSNGGVAGPRWGLRGAENLGNGLTAIFVLESGYSVNNGATAQGGRLFGRQSFVGLQSDQLGKLTVGRQYTTMFDVLANFLPMAYAPLYEPSTAILGPAFRQDNMVKYAIAAGALSAEAHFSFGAGQPTSGFTTLAAGGNGEVPGHFRDDTAYGAAVTYMGGSFGATAVYDQWNPAPATGAAGRTRKASVAANYAWGPSMKLFAGYRWGSTQDAAGATLLHDNLYWAGAVYQVTQPLSLTVAYYYDQIKTMHINAATPETNLPSPWQAVLQADYGLSKRTDVYLTMAYARHSGLNLDTVATGPSLGYPLESGQSGQVGVALGIRHRF